MAERVTHISTQLANGTFGNYNALYVCDGKGMRARVFGVNSIVDIDPQDPETYVDGIKRIRNGIPHALVRTDIDFTNACNNDCPPCFARKLREKYPKEIPYSKAVSIMDDLNHLGCDCLRFCGGGDPLDHPNFVDLVKYSGGRFKTVILTNGDNLTIPGYIEAIAQNAHRIRFSIDAGDNKTRALTHRPKTESCNYDQLIRNITKLRTEADRSQGRPSGLFIEASYIYGPQNYTLVGKFLKDMSDVGVNSVQLKPELYYGRRPTETIEQAVAQQENDARS